MPLSVLETKLLLSLTSKSLVLAKTEDNWPEVRQEDGAGELIVKRPIRMIC